jgi:hypothetical protein
MANREINFIVGGRQAAKSNRQNRSNAREIGQVNTENPQRLCWSQSLSPGKIIRFTSPIPGLTHWSSTP